MVEGNASSPVSPGKGPSRDLALAQEAYKTSDVELMVAAHDACCLARIAATIYPGIATTAAMQLTAR